MTDKTKLSLVQVFEDAERQLRIREETLMAHIHERQQALSERASAIERIRREVDAELQEWERELDLREQRVADKEGRLG
jgi:hypothetical protein